MGLGEVGLWGREWSCRSLYERLEIGHIFSPLIAFFASQQSKAFGASCSFLSSMYRFYFKKLLEEFFIGVHRNLLEDSQQTLNIFF